MSDPIEGGRHRAPDPPPSSTGGGFTAWVVLLVLVAVVGVAIGAATGNSVGWGMFAISLTVLAISVAVNRVQPGSPVIGPRARREAAYAGRTVERASIWWVVYRALNGIFR